MDSWTDMDSTLEIPLKVAFLLFYQMVRSGQRSGCLWLFLQPYSAEISGRIQRRYRGLKQRLYRQSRLSRQKHTTEGLFCRMNLNRWIKSFYALLFSRTNLNSLQKQLNKTMTNRTGPIHQCQLLWRAVKQLTLQGERGLHLQERQSPSMGTNSAAEEGRPEKAQVTPLILQCCCV